MLAVGAANSTADTGRYRIEGSGTYFLLVDTQTGRVWTVNFMATNKGTDGDFFSAKQ
jgi:hypothetical protein